MNWKGRTGTIVVLLGLITLSCAGCLSGEEGQDPIRIAFTVKDDYENADADPQRLADFIADQTGREVELYPIADDTAAIEALRFGHADAALLDGGAAWLGWQKYDLDAIAADQRDDGRTFYLAQAWVKSGSGITDFADLEGVDSCHTGWLKSAGMLMPMGYLIGNNYTDVVGPDDDITSLQATIDAFFGTATIPASGARYSGYTGAFECMADGTGDVAFVRDSSYEEHCEGNAWCEARSNYSTLPPFGEVPTHPVMVNRDRSDGDLINDLQAALLALNDSDEGRSILENVLETPGITAVSTEEHLGSYSDAISNVPGMQQYFEEQFETE